MHFATSALKISWEDLHLFLYTGQSFYPEKVNIVFFSFFHLKNFVKAVTKFLEVLKKDMKKDVGFLFGKVSIDVWVQLDMRLRWFLVSNKTWMFFYSFILGFLKYSIISDVTIIRKWKYLLSGFLSFIHEYFKELAGFVTAIAFIAELFIFTSATPVTKPRPPTATSIPAILKVLQDEWVSLIIYF